MDIIGTAYKKIAAAVLCLFSTIGLATGIRQLTSGGRGRLRVVNGGDGPTAIFSAGSDMLTSLLRLAASWSVIIGVISTLLLALIKKYSED